MEKDLLPWILGGALIATGAIAAALEFSQRASRDTASVSSAPPAARVATEAPPSPAMPAESAPVDKPPGPDAGAPAAGIPAPTPPSADVSANSAPPLQPGQIWQCVVNGQKIFSDKRCGAGASVRQLGDLNVMHVPASAPQPPYGMYEPGDAGSAYPPSGSYPDDQDDGGYVDSEGYAGQALIVARERARRERSHHRENHPHPTTPSHGVSGPHGPH